MIARIVAALVGVAMVALAAILASRGHPSQAGAAGIVGGTFILWAIRRPNQLPAGGESPRGEWPPSNRRPGDISRKEPR